MILITPTFPFIEHVRDYCVKQLFWRMILNCRDSFELHLFVTFRRFDVVESAELDAGHPC